MKKCIEILLEGRVQGVGFRNFTLNIALRHDIKGYVKNTHEGNLEIVCCGSREDVDKFVNEIKRGPSFAFISKIRINDYADNVNFKDFKIIY
ncbi:MAG: acylphosphatase [Actinomycetota bacterium]|nr:acylphosphatase [Actinomycetota bacterium]